MEKNLLYELFFPHIQHNQIAKMQTAYTQYFKYYVTDKGDSKPFYYSLNSPDILNSEMELPKPD